MPINIAIDGPAGAGKSTVAKKLAEDYGYIYVDTGAMYRAMALYFLRQGIDSHDEAAIGRACETVSISLEYENGIQQVYLNGENVSSELRTEAVGNMASNTSVYAPVRKKLVELQRELAGRRDVVMDGRDIGTAVLPDATLKVYLTASSRVRAGRRYKELTERGESCSLEAIEQDIIERDYRDMHRELSPLKQAEDAILLDTSALNFEEVMREMEKLVEAAKKKHDELAMRIEEIETRGQNLRHFQETLESLNGQVTEFDSDLWGSLVDYITVYENGEKTVTFRDGSVI